MIGLETVTYNERSPNQREIEMDNYLNENNMSKEMNWDTFVPTREIREYDMLSTGIKYFNTCSEYWLYKLESEYIKAEKEYLAKQTDI